MRKDSFELRFSHFIWAAGFALVAWLGALGASRYLPLGQRENRPAPEELAGRRAQAEASVAAQLGFIPTGTYTELSESSETRATLRREVALQAGECLAAVLSCAGAFTPSKLIVVPPNVGAGSTVQLATDLGPGLVRHVQLCPPEAATVMVVGQFAKRYGVEGDAPVRPRLALFTAPRDRVRGPLSRGWTLRSHAFDQAP